MERYQEAREYAKRKIKIADHMLGVTFPLVKDPRLLLAIIENIFLAYTNSIAALLHYERLYKRIPPFRDDSFESKFNMFRERCVIKHKIDKSYLTEIQDIKDIIVAHRKSPVEFKRRDMLVICSDNYRMKTIGVYDLQKYLDKAKVFIEAIDIIIVENG